MSPEAEPQEQGRRGRRGRDRGAPVAPSGPPPQPKLPFPPLDLVSADELESIHQAALTVLAEIGMDFLHDGARAILKDAGAEVDAGSKRVRFPPALVESQIGLAPREFTLHARNPARNVAIGGRNVAFGSVASAPNSADRAGGRQARQSSRLPEFHPPRADLRRRSISGPAIRSSRSTSTPRSAISTLCSTC